MRGIILAAGRGSRLGQLTEAIPKCLVPLAGKPLLEWQVDALEAGGAGPLAIVSGYMSERLNDARFTPFVNHRWEQTNMVMSLAAAASWLEDGPCLVSYSDIVYRPDTVAALRVAEGDLVITYDTLWQSLWERRFADPLSDAETFLLDGDGRLAAIGQKPESLAEIQGQYMGILKFTPQGWSSVRQTLDRLPPDSRDRLDMTGLLNLLLGAGVRIDTVAVEGRWCEVDTETDLALYQQLAETEDGWTHDWRPQG